MSCVKRKIFAVVYMATANYLAADAVSKSGLVVDALPITSKVGNHKLASPNFRKNLIDDCFVGWVAFDSVGTKSAVFHAFFETLCKG